MIRRPGRPRGSRNQTKKSPPSIQEDTIPADFPKSLNDISEVQTSHNFDLQSTMKFEIAKCTAHFAASEDPFHGDWPWW